MKQSGLSFGSIEIITGPMFAGKTEELIRRLRRAQVARLNVQIFKHAADTRYSVDQLASHSDWRLDCQSVKFADEIMDAVSPGVHMVGIDEAQFFSAAIAEIARSLSGRGIRVIIAALDLDYLGKPFGPVPDLLAGADDVTKLHAVCVQCSKPARFSQRVVPASERVLIGTADSYEARCRSCFVPGFDLSRGVSVSDVPARVLAI